MLDRDTRAAILRLAAAGHGKKAIARALGVSKNTVKEVLANGVSVVPAMNRASRLDGELDTVIDLHLRCKGNLVRVHEELLERGIEVAYPTLTAFCRSNDIGVDPKRPAGTYHFEPGEEMQHDTSPHEVVIAGRRCSLQCASLILCFSRKQYIQLYERWSRLECRHFLSEGVVFIGGAADRCMLDNSTVIIAHGTGKNAVPAPAMAALSQRFGFTFVAHEVGDADRSGRVERVFHYVEHNCLKRRRSRFEDLLDLNRHAKWWCDEVANVRIHGTTRQRLVDLLERNEISPTATPWSTEAAARTAAAAGTTAAMVAAVATDRPPTLLEELRRNLKALKLGAMLAELDDALEEAQTTQQGYATFLAGLVRKQLAARMAAAYARRIDKAEFPCKRGFDDFDWTFQPGLNVQLVKDLMTLDFVRQARPVLLLGKPGTGKTHLSIALGRRAAEAGHRVRFYKATRLLQELYATLADGSTQRLVRYLARLDVLVIDDLRALPPQPEYASLLYELVEARHGHKTTIVSSNLSLSAWGQVLGDKTLTASMVDRLMERAHVLNIKKGRSYRTEGPEAPPADDQPKDLDARDETES